MDLSWPCGAVVRGPVLGANAWCGCVDKHWVILQCLSTHPHHALAPKTRWLACAWLRLTPGPQLRFQHRRIPCADCTLRDTPGLGPPPPPEQAAPWRALKSFFHFPTPSSPSRKVAHFGLKPHIKTCAFRQPVFTIFLFFFLWCDY